MSSSIIAGTGPRQAFSAIAEVLRASTTTRVQSVIADSLYKHDLVRTWTTNICDVVLEDAKALCSDYKLMVSVVIVQKNGAGLNTHAAAYWDPSTDGSIAVTVDKMEDPSVVRRKSWAKPHLHIDKLSQTSFPAGANTTNTPVRAKTTHGTPIIRYEAHTSPHLPFEKDEPWWAFLVRYRNIQLSLSALFYWILCLVLHGFCTKITYTRGVHQYNLIGTPPLHDLFHEWFPNTQTYRVLPEIGHVLPVLYLSGLMLYHFDQRSLDCFRTFLVAHGTLIAIRAISFVGTLLPDASQQCHISLFVGSCHDLIFSGHVMIMLLSVFLAQHFFFIPAAIRLMVGLDATVVSLMVVSSRNHYTVDVVLAVVITFIVYLAFTRHPYLVSLCVETPVNVLSIPCYMDADQRAVFCGCRAGRPPKTTREGYPLLTNAEALKRMTEHAHGALRLMGLRPKVVITRPSASVSTHMTPQAVGEEFPLFPPNELPFMHAASMHSKTGSSSATGVSGGSAPPSMEASVHARKSAAAVRRNSSRDQRPSIAESIPSDIPRSPSSHSLHSSTRRASGTMPHTPIDIGGQTSARWVQNQPRPSSSDPPRRFTNTNTGGDAFDRLATLRERMDSTISETTGSEGSSGNDVTRNWSRETDSQSPGAAMLSPGDDADTSNADVEGVRHRAPSAWSETARRAKRGRAHSSMNAAEYEQWLSLNSGASRNRYLMASQPLVISPDGRVIGIAAVQSGDRDAVFEDEAGNAYVYEGYAMDPSLRDSIEEHDYVPNGPHFARGIRHAYRRLHASARRLFEWAPVGPLRGWVAAGGDPPYEEELGEEDDDEQDEESGAGDAESGANDQEVPQAVQSTPKVPAPPRRHKPKRL